MTDQEIRIAIALETGFSGCVDESCDYRKCQHLHKESKVYFPEPFSIPMYPDYPNSLDAMREAEEYAPLSYWEMLEIVTRPGFRQESDIGRNSIRGESLTQRLARVASATSRQRAEAFLRDKKKWKD